MINEITERSGKTDTSEIINLIQLHINNIILHPRARCRIFLIAKQHNI